MKTSMNPQLAVFMGSGKVTKFEAESINSNVDAVASNVGALVLLSESVASLFETKPKGLAVYLLESKVQ